MALTILIAGGTGQIGSRLTEVLRNKGHQVRLLSRTPQGADQYGWDLKKKVIDDNAVSGADIVINLTGAGIADKRWTPARKQLLIDSRVDSANLLRESFQRLGYQPKAYLSASAVGYYGDAGDAWVHEYDAPADNSFMVECCTLWEQAVEAISAMGIRTVVLRTGIVLDKEGGALREIIKPMRFGAGGYFGDGQAWYSWIHHEDICQMYLWAAEHPEVEGIFNAVAPNPVRNIELIKATAKAMHQPAIFAPAPEFALRLVFGEMADAILFSIRASAEKIIQAGYRFHHPDLESALEEIFT
ncbi:MAG: TIGR01777 family protein [Bacteroidetes bacterium]|nr:MAG: TIGR01777 family protein [Bacteroidota bacterium]